METQKVPKKKLLRTRSVELRYAESFFVLKAYSCGWCNDVVRADGRIAKRKAIRHEKSTKRTRSKTKKILPIVSIPGNVKGCCESNVAIAPVDMVHSNQLQVKCDSRSLMVTCSCSPGDLGAPFLRWSSRFCRVVSFSLESGKSSLVEPELLISRMCPDFTTIEAQEWERRQNVVYSRFEM